MNTVETPTLRNVTLTRLAPRLVAMKRRIRDGEHHRLRDTETIDVRSECEAEGLSWLQRAARLTRRMCEAQTVVIEPDERLVFTRTVRHVPPLHSAGEVEALTAGRTLHELGPISNICADWGMVLSQGLLGRRQIALATRQRLAADAEAIEFLDCAIETIDAVLALAQRYAEAARQTGRQRWPMSWLVCRRILRDVSRGAPVAAAAARRALAQRPLPLSASAASTSICGPT